MKTVYVIYNGKVEKAEAAQDGDTFFVILPKSRGNAKLFHKTVVFKTKSEANEARVKGRGKRMWRIESFGFYGDEPAEVVPVIAYKDEQQFHWIYRFVKPEDPSDTDWKTSHSNDFFETEEAAFRRIAERSKDWGVFDFDVREAKASALREYEDEVERIEKRAAKWRRFRRTLKKYGLKVYTQKQKSSRRRRVSRPPRRIR